MGAWVRFVVVLSVFCALARLASSPVAGERSGTPGQPTADAVAAASGTTSGLTGGGLDTGLAGSKNFTVAAPRGDHLAEKVLRRAEELRREIALAWLGEELLDGKGRTHIALELTKDKDEGLTWLCGGGRQVHGDHRMFLTTTAERATGSTLAHEVTHVVLSVHFPEGMPAWANEGIASLADDEERHQARRQLTRQWVLEGRWPSLDKLLNQRTLPASDEAGYAASVALVQFLLSKGDRQGLIEFVAKSQQNGWDSALRKCYGIPRTDELQRQWREWVTHEVR